MLNTLEGENKLIPVLRNTRIRKSSKGIFLQKPDSRKKLFINEDLFKLLNIIDGTKTILDIKKEFKSNKKVKEIILSINKEKIIDLEYVPSQQNVSFCEYNFPYNLDMIYFEPTERCNFKCIHCYASAPIKKDFSNELNTKGLERLIKQIDEMGVLEICFTGGESFCSEKTLELSQEFHNKGIKLSYITNASLINERRIEELKQIKPSFVRVSFHSHKKGEFEKITGTKNYDKVLNNIMKLKEAGIVPAISCTLFNGINNSYIHIKEFLKFFKEKGFEAKDISFDEFVPDGCGKISKQYKINEEEAIKNIEKAFMKIFNYKPIKNESPLKDSYCGVGVSSLAIKSNGDITLCPVLQEPILGNLKNEDIKTIWENLDIFKYFRNKEYLRGTECEKCISLESCFGGCKSKSLTFYGTMNAKDPWMCAHLKNDFKN